MPTVHGRTVDDATRCVHYHGPDDVVALRCRRCDRYYPCHRCHDEAEDHAFGRWPPDAAETPAVLCGLCGSEMRPEAYLASDDVCPACGTGFNPACRRHRDRYFETEG